MKKPIKGNKDPKKPLEKIPFEEYFKIGAEKRRDQREIVIKEILNDTINNGSLNFDINI